MENKRRTFGSSHVDVLARIFLRLRRQKYIPWPTLAYMTDIFPVLTFTYGKFLFPLMICEYREFNPE